MNTGILERIRLLEADIENNVDSMVQQMLLKDVVTHPRHLLLIDHFIASKINEITTTADSLADLYLDEDDIVTLRDAPSQGKDILAAAFTEFEAKAADSRERGATLGHSLPPVKHQLSRPSPKMLDSIFSPPERHGCLLHLQNSHRRYFRFMEETGQLGSRCEPGGDVTSGRLLDAIREWNTQWTQCEDYLEMVASIPQLIKKDLPAHRKLVGFRAYKEWIDDLLAYLEGFYCRIHPLERETLEQLTADTDLKADEYWSALRQVPDIPWVVGDVSSSSSVSMNAKRLSGLAVPSALLKYLDNFSLWPLPYIQSVLTEAASGSFSGDETVAGFPQSMEDVKSVCYSEGRIIALLKSLLYDTYQHTENYLKRSQSKTLDELEKERMDDDTAFAESLKAVQKHAQNTVEGTIAQAAQYHVEAGDLDGSRKDGEKAGGADTAADEEEDEDGQEQQLIGDDGKPIPRWLVIQQQLKKTFVCDICGGTVYRGPKQFKDHFGQERHTEGLRRVGVTQSLKSYEGLTLMREVVEMRDRLAQAVVGTRKRLREEKALEKY